MNIFATKERSCFNHELSSDFQCGRNGLTQGTEAKCQLSGHLLYLLSRGTCWVVMTLDRDVTHFYGVLWFHRINSFSVIMLSFCSSRIFFQLHGSVIINFWPRQEPKQSQCSFVRSFVRSFGSSLSRALNSS